MLFPTRFSAAVCVAAVLGLLPTTGYGADDFFSQDTTHPAIDLHKQKTLYVVPYAHLDTQWRWSYPQVIRQFIAETLHKNFALIDKYPHYVFNFSGSRRYEMMHEYYPEDWARLQGYIKAGRWFPCGSSVDEGDANVPGLESMIRHVLYGNHYFRREFGVASDEFMLPDCFGFPASLPTILAHCGLKGFSTQKLTWGSAVGIPFKIGNWIGPDGSALPAALDPGAYTGQVKDDLSKEQGWLTRIEHTGAESGIFADYHYYGTGDRGGSPEESSVSMVEKSVTGGGPVHVVSSKAQQLFEDLPADAKGKLPHYQGDLLLVEHSSGSITSQAYMKRWNRKNELLADGAERAAVSAAALGGAPYPTKKLYDAWDLTLGSQMHDMLPGTSLPKAYEYCWNDDVLAANQFAAVEEDSVATVAAALDTQVRAGGVPLVVYNPLSVAREDVVEGSMPGTDPAASVQVLGPDGRAVPTQVTGFANGTVQFLFLAKVAPVSFTTFEAQAAPGAKEVATGALQMTSRTLENTRYRVTINDAGDVASIVDKDGKHELLAKPMRLEFQQENPGQFPAWNMDWRDAQKPPRGVVEGPANIRVAEKGPVRVTLEIERRAEGSRFVSRVSLAAGGAGEALEFHDQIDWGTSAACLKAAFPLTVSNPLAAYDDKVGAPMRGNNEPKKYEVPQHEWLDLTNEDGQYGVSILNDCKFGSDKPDDHTVRLTLLYTPGVKGEYQDQGSQDWGRQDLAYAVYGHAGSWQKAGTVAQGHRFNQPLRAFAATAHPGALGRAFSLVSVDNPQVEITAIKKAEDSTETVVRLRELGGQGPQSVRLRFAAPVTAARAVDGQERELPTAGGAGLDKGEIFAQMPPYSLRTFALKLGALPARVALPTAAYLGLSFDQDVVSTRANRGDGNFDGEGRTFPAEMLPNVLVSEGVPFRLGSGVDGQRNALSCRGQAVVLPPGDYDRVELLAASAHGDKPVSFDVVSVVNPADKAGTRTANKVKVQDWGGYVGQWDNRQWKGKVPELTYGWTNALDGLVPGFVKTATVAWYSSHRNEHGGPGIYDYCYLFKYGFDLPKGARSLVLPNEPDVRVFAATVVKGGHAAVQAARPLFDTFADHQATAPSGFEPVPGKYSDATAVKIVQPLYWSEGGLHYTIDGTDPTADSPRYTGTIPLHGPTTLKARMFLPGTPGGGPVATARYEIDDHTPPAVRSAEASTLRPEVRVVFSEPVDAASADTAANYHFEPAGVNIVAARHTADGTGVTLALAAPLGAGGERRLVVNGVCDASPARNAVKGAVSPVTLAQPAFAQADTMVCDGKNTRDFPVAGLPTGGKEPWTINFFARTDHQPENRTLIAGFGKVEDAEGHARYLGKFGNGLHFWSSHHDAETTTPLELGRWQMLSATYDGETLRMYKDALPVGTATMELSNDEAVVHIAPVDPWDQQRRFQGKVARMTVWKEALNAAALAALSKNVPGEAD